MNIPRPSLAVYLMADDDAPALAEAAVRGGATVIELGIPYSDPLADGTTIQRAAQAAPYTGSPDVRRLFTLAFADPGECIRPEAMAMLDLCQGRGLRTGILTNDMRDFNEPGWSDRVEFVQRVDAVTDGSITGVLKPDPRAYEIAVEALGVSPASTLFIDDQPFNIKGAQNVGLQTVWFDVTDPAGSYARARALL